MTDDLKTAGDLKIAGRLEVVKDAGALAARAAEIIAERVRVAQYPFRMVLSGGSTPRAAYQLLACKDLDWDCVELFFGDERFVPPDHKDSNYRMASEALLQKIIALGLRYRTGA